METVAIHTEPIGKLTRHSTMATRYIVQRRGNNAPVPVPAAAPMDRKGR